MEGQVAIVTGSTSGIGLGIAHRLATGGCSVVLTGLGEHSHIDSILQDFSRKYSGQIDFVPVNLSDITSIQTFCSEVDEMHPHGVNILVNNAGIQHVCNVDEYPVEKWNEMIAVNLSAPFHLIRHFLPALKRKGFGRIINISSQMGIVSAPGKAPYSATKAGLIGLTKGVALEAADSGVTCNAICPGFVLTPLIQAQIETFGKTEGLSYKDAEEKFFKALHPTKKPVQIEQVAELVMYLCSPGASSITGSAMLMDGGFTSQ